MAQVFHPAMNTLSRISLLLALLLLGAAGFVVGAVARSSYVTEVNVVIDQPIPFSHKHHVQQIGIDCRYCHTSVEQSSFAGMPSTETCMGCHSKIWDDSPMLAPVRASWREGRPIRWKRVHDLADFVYFDHSIHVAKGVGCSTCHGRVDEMPLMWKTQTLQMDWCLQCHRNPAPSLRPRDQVFAMDWPSPAESEAADPLAHFTSPVRTSAHGAAPAAQGSSIRVASGPLHKEVSDASHLTDCSVCHR